MELIQPTHPVAWYANRWAAPALLFLVACLFYYNAVPGEYVLDDGLVLNQNSFVKQGLAGIPDIFTHDSFYGSVGNSANLNGGRYRPLALVTYAIEYQLYGLQPHYSRAINVFLYALTGVFVFFFLSRFVFTTSVAGAFVASLIFVMHPIHTEVVANIKSRDEILSFLLLLGALYWLLAAVQGGFGLGRYLTALLHFALALLTKENGLAFIAIVPLTLFVFTRRSFAQIVNLTLPFAAVVVGYFALRVGLIGFSSHEVTELMDNPFMLATTEEKYATIAVVFLKYLKLLLYPHPLTYDYSYNQIPYAHVSDALVWLSLLLNGALLFVALFDLRNRSLFSWCILFYYLSLFMVSNLVINIGAPMGERFLYQAGFPLGIALVALFNNASVRWTWPENMRRIVALAVLIPVTALAFYKTHERNKVWLVGERLGLTDVKTSNNSARALTYAGINLLTLADKKGNEVKKDSLTRAAIPYLEKAVRIHPRFGMAWQNLGAAYYNTGNVDAAGKAWLQMKQSNMGIGTEANNYLHTLAMRYYSKALDAGVHHDFNKSISGFHKALSFDDSDPEIWYNLGGAYYSVGKFDSAKIAWLQTLQLKPNHQQAQQGLRALPPHS